jgi:undecaprenyl-diphosphatase
MHDILLSIILGVVEGVTEFLPISSTAHLLVTEQLLGLGADWEAFTVVIQLGAILAVVAIYFQTFWKALIGLPTSADARRFALGIILALIPSVIAGLALKKLLDAVLLNPATAMPFIAGCWIVGGVILLLVERIAPPPRWFEGNNLPLSKAFQIGCCQVLSIIPGVSRSGATILGGELLGVERRAATMFTFYLAVPTMMGATILELHHKAGALSHGQGLNIAIGFGVSFVVAFFVIKSFLKIVTKYGLRPFGWYRIAAGLALIAYLAIKA